MSMQRVDRKAFTLIETLVVIGIVLLLAAIVFPVMSRVRMSGHRSVAISNTRQILQAIEIYSIDHGGLLPFSKYLPDGYWMKEIGLTSSGTATLRDPLFTYGSEPDAEYPYLAGYALNACLRPAINPRNSVNPARTILVAPVSIWKITGEQFLDWHPAIMLATPDTRLNDYFKDAFPKKTYEVQGAFGATRYFGAGVYGFVDGHVRSLKPDQIELMPDDDPCGIYGALKTPNTNTGPTFVAWPE